MSVKKVVGTCLAALFLGACGEGVVETSSPEATASTEQAILWACTGANTWTRTWKRNGVETGREDCNCDGSVTQYGQVGGTYQQVAGGSCR